MGYSSPITNRIGKMITGDPRAPQVAFLVPVLAFVLLLIVFRAELLAHPLMMSGIAVVALATLFTFAAPWSRLPALALVSIPLLDLAGIGLLRLNPEVGAVGVLVVFPAMWLGLVFRARGVGIVILASIVVLTIPSILYFGTSLEGWSRAILMPAVAFMTAMTMDATAEIWASQRAKLEEQGAQLERALAVVTKQRKLGEAIVDTVDVGLLALSADGSYESFNPRHREFLDLSYPEGHAGAAGQLGFAYSEDSLAPLTYDQMPTVRATRGEAFSDCTIWVGEEPAERRALSVSARPVFDGAGEFDGAVLAYKDVTELMHALQIKDEFVASVSHELRTPLTSIIGYIDLIRDDSAELSQEVNHRLSVVGRNAERLLLLVSDLLTTAQAEDSSLHLSLERTDLASVVRRSVAESGPCAAEAQVRLRAEIAPLPLASVDVERFIQVVENLLSNAIKYTPAGGSIGLDLEQEGDGVLLTVCDTGIGVSLADQQQMFTKFFRATSAQERAIPGVGLGLVITKLIVEGHGGTIDVDSQEGVGTTVRVRLPLTSEGAVELREQSVVSVASE
ncbi:MAG TPA: HAMP domain-containing sensor histidine kinase [Nocardioidaceae bacterium]|nr:HAMP domain-containing sensor histidine kinase [Nocardioidaceae bacterium]